jgi:hypothetical protein
MVSVLVSKAVDRGFIAGVMVNVLISKAVDRGFISGVMVSVLSRNAFETRMVTFNTTDEPTIYRFRDKNANLPPMNPRSTAFEISTLTIMVDCEFIGGALECLSRKRNIVGSSVA